MGSCSYSVKLNPDLCEGLLIIYVYTKQLVKIIFKKISIKKTPDLYVCKQEQKKRIPWDVNIGNLSDIGVRISVSNFNVACALVINALCCKYACLCVYRLLGLDMYC